MKTNICKMLLVVGILCISMMFGCTNSITGVEKVERLAEILPYCDEVIQVSGDGSDGLIAFSFFTKDMFEVLERVEEKLGIGKGSNDEVSIGAELTNAMLGNTAEPGKYYVDKNGNGYYLAFTTIDGISSSVALAMTIGADKRKQ